MTRKTSKRAPEQAASDNNPVAAIEEAENHRVIRLMLRL